MISSSTTVGIILAGGLSRRMGGGDKSLLPLAGEPLISRTIRKLSAQTKPLIINANGEAGRFSSFNLPVIADTFDGFAGPLAGVLTGMEWARDHAPDASHIVTVAADTPFFPDDLLSRFSKAANEHPDAVVLAETGGKTHSVFGLWPISLCLDLRHWLEGGDNRKVLAWTDRHMTLKVPFDDLAVSCDPFFNINRPEDLDFAHTLIQEQT